MRRSVWLITVLFLIGCQAGTPPGSEPDLVEAVTFSTWPSGEGARLSLPLLWQCGAVAQGPAN